MKVIKIGNSLGVIIPKNMTFNEGDRVEWVYSEDMGVFCLVFAKDWKYYVSLEKVPDKELYERYKNGQLKCSGLGGYMLKKRIDDYILRMAGLIIDGKLRGVKNENCNHEGTGQNNED